MTRQANGPPATVPGADARANKMQIGRQHSAGIKGARVGARRDYIDLIIDGLGGKMSGEFVRVMPDSREHFGKRPAINANTHMQVAATKAPAGRRIRNQDAPNS